MRRAAVVAMLADRSAIMSGMLYAQGLSQHDDLSLECE